ncbi:hypothetical protein GCM10011509_28220 [Ornithinimicrobium pekingense]|uniref:Uncharacterized protein n=1 Tax=Ornithinimicrobium pekingense TaxID=384677 RepID=A0ABQ2FAY0_9MICO|nr:hypothetical protein GCM10011509_28220 [Ornithinimicrobium pekingense]
MSNRYRVVPGRPAILAISARDRKREKRPRVRPTPAGTAASAAPSDVSPVAGWASGGGASDGGVGWAVVGKGLVVTAWPVRTSQGTMTCSSWAGVPEMTSARPVMSSGVRRFGSSPRSGRNRVPCSSRARAVSERSALSVRGSPARRALVAIVCRRSRQAVTEAASPVMTSWAVPSSSRTA